MTDALEPVPRGLDQAIVDRAPTVGLVQHARACLGQQFVIGKGQRQHREIGRGIGLARARLAGEQVVRGQAPAPPLHQRAGRQIADDADARAGEIAEQRRQGRCQHMPQQRRRTFRARRQVACRTAADGDVHQAGEALARGQQRRHLAAEAVADDEQRQLGRALDKLAQQGVVILVQPVAEIGLDAAARPLERSADTTVVEGPGNIAALGQVVCERRVERLRHGHRRGDDHLATRRAMRVEAMDGEFVSVGGGEGNGLHRRPEDIASRSFTMRRAFRASMKIPACGQQRAEQFAVIEQALGDKMHHGVLAFAFHLQLAGDAQ